MDVTFLSRQQELFEMVTQSILEYPNKERANLKEIESNINTLKEEIKVGKEDDLPGLFYQMNLQLTLAEKFSKPNELPNIQSPYFGYMCLEQDGKNIEILLGHISFSDYDRSIRIVDWKRAPIAALFYQYEEGDEYDLDLPEREISGVIKSLAIITIHEGKLVRVDRASKSYILEHNKWKALDELVPQLGGGEASACRELGVGITNYNSPEVISLMDPHQYSLLKKDVNQPLVIVGGAGSGKTTVALHRVAHLCHEGHHHPGDILIIVPHKGLIRLARNLLNKIKITAVDIKTCTHWIEDQARKLYPGLPQKVCVDTPLEVVQIKRHPLFIELIEKYIQLLKKTAKDKLEKVMNCDLTTIFNQSLDLKSILDQIKSQSDLDTLTKVACDELLVDLFQIRKHLCHLFTHNELLADLAEKSLGQITLRMTRVLTYHTMMQTRRDEENLEENNDYSEYTVDGKSLSASTPFDVRGTIDQEDFALCLKMLHLLTGHLATPRNHVRKYRHLVIDEAQELASVELQIMGLTLKKEGNVTVCGDALQQIDPSTNFLSWDQVLTNLGLPASAPQELKISYRSPESIIRFAHHVLGPLSLGQQPESKRKGPEVLITQTLHHAHACLIIRDVLRKLLLNEPRASIGIICSSSQNANDFYYELKDLGPVRHVVDSDYQFKPGIDVTTVEQVRGLEFDYVIVPDADAQNYPEENRARKRLHLAATRSIHQLWVLHGPRKSVLVN